MDPNFGSLGPGSFPNQIALKGGVRSAREKNVSRTPDRKDNSTSTFLFFLSVIDSASDVTVAYIQGLLVRISLFSVDYSEIYRKHL